MTLLSKIPQPGEQLDVPVGNRACLPFSRYDLLTGNSKVGSRSGEGSMC